MAKLLDNEFTQYEFTQEEELLAYSFSDIQLQGLRTQLAIVTAEKLNLSPDVHDTLYFKLEHRYLQGKMDIIRGFIMVSEGIKKEMEERLKSEQGQKLQFER